MPPGDGNGIFVGGPLLFGEPDGGKGNGGMPRPPGARNLISRVVWVDEGKGRWGNGAYGGRSLEEARLEARRACRRVGVAYRLSSSQTKPPRSIAISKACGCSNCREYRTRKPKRQRRKTLPSRRLTTLRSEHGIGACLAFGCVGGCDGVNY